MTKDVAGLLQRLSESGTNVELNETGGIRLTGYQPPPEVVHELKVAKGVIVELLRLEKGLDIGWEECEAAANPATRMRCEDHWIALLHEYERYFVGGALAITAKEPEFVDSQCLRSHGTN